MTKVEFESQLMPLIEEYALLQQRQQLGEDTSALQQENLAKQHALREKYSAERVD